LPETVEGLEDRPEVDNLVGIYAALAGIGPEAVLAEWGGKGFGQFKPALADLVVAKLAPISAEMRRLKTDTAALDAILRAGGEKAAALAAPIMSEVRALVGLWR
jgi:tryptophanyl-tRNA synthetase